MHSRDGHQLGERACEGQGGYGLLMQLRELYAVQCRERRLMQLLPAARPHPRRVSHSPLSGAPRLPMRVQHCDVCHSTSKDPSCPSWRELRGFPPSSTQEDGPTQGFKRRVECALCCRQIIAHPKWHCPSPHSQRARAIPPPASASARWQHPPRLSLRGSCCC